MKKQDDLNEKISKVIKHTNDIGKAGKKFIKGIINEFNENNDKKVENNSTYCDLKKDDCNSKKENADDEINNNKKIESSNNMNNSDIIKYAKTKINDTRNKLKLFIENTADRWAYNSKNKSNFKSKKSRFGYLGIFLVIIFMVVAVIKGGNSGSQISNTKNKEKWSDILIKDKIPEFKSSNIHIVENEKNILKVEISDVSESDFKSYIKEVKQKGFDIDANDSETNYSAFNKEDYKISLDYLNVKKELSINVTELEKLGEIFWSTSEKAGLLPKPSFELGKVISDNKDRYSVIINKMPLEKYKEYIKKCHEMGFNIDVKNEEKVFKAYNSDKYKLEVSYLGAGRMAIGVYEPIYDLKIKTKCDANWFFSKYDVEYYIDDEKIGKIEHGKDHSVTGKYKKGVHKIKYVKDEESSVYGEIDFEVLADGEFEFNIHCTSSRVEISEVKNPNAKKANKTVNKNPDNKNKDTNLISMAQGTAYYLGKSYEDAKNELIKNGFSNISLEEVETYDNENGRVSDVLANSKKFNKGDTLNKNTEIKICYWKTLKKSKYETALVKRGPKYSIYYMFDEDENKVIRFTTDDNSPDEYTYEGDLFSGLIINCTDGVTEWKEGFIYNKRSKKYIYTDAPDSFYEFDSCSVQEAQNVLDS
ncbi:MAG: DUF6591 domain-containing protein [Erysipelotrichaceae bacterium]|nr:DUF6591 domain-containing protein [Erysipelotrichaceae bacterium]